MPMNKQRVEVAEDQISESVAEAQQCIDTMFDNATKKIDLAVLKTYCLQFTVAVLLEELRRRDQQRADELILWINEALEAGDTAGELVWDWHAQIGRGHAPTNVGPYSAEQPLPPAEARTITIPTQEDGDVEVLAVDGSTPGLLLAQRLRYDQNRQAVSQAGKWGVLHASTLRFVVPAGWPLDTAHTVAEQFGGIGINWTRCAEDVAAARRSDPSIGVKIQEIVAAVEGCRYCTDADHAVHAWRAKESVESASGPATTSS